MSVYIGFPYLEFIFYCPVVIASFYSAIFAYCITFGLDFISLIIVKFLII